MIITSSSIIKKLLLAFLIIAGLFFAKSFLIPLCIAGILATLFLPFCKWMEKKEGTQSSGSFNLPVGLIVNYYGYSYAA